MFNLIIPGLLFIGTVIGICVKLKNWKQRVFFLLVLFIAIPGGLLYWFQWGWKNREEKLMKAQAECRKEKTVEGIDINFFGFSEKDLMKDCLTIHKNAKGSVLDSNRQQLDTTRFYNGDLGAAYRYRLPLRVSDILEITVGKKRYRLSNFVLTAAANYNMGGAIVSGCRIDSADINAKRLPFDQNMIIRKTDDY